MRPIFIAVLTALMTLAAPAARAHAFLDHAKPAVGSSVEQSPSAVELWFTQDLEGAFSTVTVTDQAGKRVDPGNASVASGDPTLLRVSLPPLPPGAYKVTWHVVSVDTHTTEGSFTFHVGK